MEPPASADTGFLRQLVFGITHNLLDPSRDYLFESRLSKLLRNQGMAGLDELVECLKLDRNPALERAIAEAMTINETSFFRDGRPFDLLRQDLLPKLIEVRRPTRCLRFWSAACSTGQEAYSLAILLREYFPMLAGWEIRIEGTDISAEVIERARQGVYHRIEMNRGLPARMAARYFDHVGEDWLVRPEIRSLCHFRQANLCATPPPFNRADDRFDLIFLRTVSSIFPRRRASPCLPSFIVYCPQTASFFLVPANSLPTPPSGLPSLPAAHATSGRNDRKQGSGFRAQGSARKCEPGNLIVGYELLTDP
jgi:chemotaxis protein methyltransferase CheR